MKTANFENLAENDRYREARQRLADRTAAIGRRAAERLCDVQRRHDLDWRLLLASQREIARLDAAGVAPTPAEFWEAEAAPRAAALTTAATLVIDGAFADVEPAVLRFDQSITPLIADSRLRSLVEIDVAAVLQPLATGILDDGPLNELGERWQLRLHRQAVRRRIVDRLGCSRDEFDEMVKAEELVLVDRAPWVHGDRYLSAFEIAHTEIRAHARSKVETTARLVAPPTPAPGPTITI